MKPILRLPFLIIFVVGIVILCCLSNARAAVNPSVVYANVGPLSLTVPWDEMSAVYLYNETEHESEVGGEMTFAQLKVGSYKSNPIDLDLTAGGVLVPNSNAVGTGFAGIDLQLPNPLGNYLNLSAIQPGLFGGYDINSHLWVFGIKAAINIFNGV